jgi:predicted DCC family thiol-disulfide oxidoreductase YuxK
MEKETPNPILIFDGVCHLCDTFVQWVLKYERQPTLTFVAGQSASGQKLLHSLGMQDLAANSVLLVRDGQVYNRSRAVFAILPYLTFPWRALVVFRIVPYRLADKIYDWVARHRYTWFGKRTACRIPDELTRGRFLP